MKSKILVLSLCLAGAAAVSIYAQTRFPHGFYLPKSDEPIYGSWVNPGNAGTNSFTYQKHVVTNWGYFENYLTVTGDQPSTRGTFVLTDRWTDSAGNTWYKRFVQVSWYPKGEFHLIRVSRNGTVLEWISNIVDWPTEEEMNAQEVLRSVFYKQ